VRRAGTVRRRRTRGVGRGARTVAALEVRENLRDDLRIFDAGDNPHRTPAALTALDIDVEHAFEAACPGHGEVLVASVQ